jgi:methylmalonyl-CoA mutase N-terminal domain/subunit
MYLAVAEKQGADWTKLRGTIQNDILKEYIAQKTYIFPPRPSMKLIVDTIEFATRHVPQWNSISISGYHIREAGSTALQELAFTLYDGIEYVEWAIRAGMDVDEFAPRLSFFFNAHNDLPHADRRVLTDCAAAVQQYRPRRGSGAGCGSWRHSVASHQFAR